MSNSHFSSDERKIFVGNLPYNISRDQLWTYFSQFGKVESAHFLKNDDGKCNGCGFVVFADIGSVATVLSRSTTQTLPILGDRKPYAKRYDPNYKYEQWRRNIVLRDLPVKTNSQNVIDALSTFGSVADVKVTPSGIGYATFKHKSDAQKCVTAGEIFLLRKKVKVSFNREDGESSGVKTQPNNSTSSRESRLFVRNLHKSIDETRLRCYFGKYGSITAVEIKKRRRTALISFTEDRAVEDALKDDHRINGYKMTVERDKTTMKSVVSSAFNQFDKLMSFLSSGKRLLGIFGLVNGIAPVLSGYPCLTLIVFFLLFIYLHLHQNTFGLKDQKYFLPGCSLIFFVALFFTAYLSNSSKYKYNNHDYYGRGNW